MSSNVSNTNPTQVTQQNNVNTLNNTTQTQKDDSEPKKDDSKSKKDDSKSKKDDSEPKEKTTKEKIRECLRFPKSYDNCLELLDYGYNMRDKYGRFRTYYDVDCRELGLPNKLICAKRKMNWPDEQGGTEKQRKALVKKYDPMIRRVCREMPYSCVYKPYVDYCPCNPNKMKFKDIPKKAAEFIGVLSDVFRDIGVEDAQNEIIPKSKKFEDNLDYSSAGISNFQRRQQIGEQKKLKEKQQKEERLKDYKQADQIKTELKNDNRWKDKDLREPLREKYVRDNLEKVISMGQEAFKAATGFKKGSKEAENLIESQRTRKENLDAMIKYSKELRAARAAAAASAPAITAASAPAITAVAPPAITAAAPAITAAAPAITAAATAAAPAITAAATAAAPAAATAAAPAITAAATAAAPAAATAPAAPASAPPATAKIENTTGTSEA
jgi:hypothetical protein